MLWIEITDLKMLLRSWLDTQKYKKYDDFQMKYCVSGWIKGLQNCRRSNLKVRKKDILIWPIHLFMLMGMGGHVFIFFSDLQLWPSAVLKPLELHEWTVVLTYFEWYRVGPKGWSRYTVRLGAGFFFNPALFECKSHQNQLFTI